MADGELTSERPIRVALLLAFVLMAALAGFDLLSDFGDGGDVGHVAVEGTILALGFAGIALIAAQWRSALRRARRASAEAAALAGELEVSRAQAETWRTEARDLMRGLGQAIDEQFDRWRLSPAEKEVALLLLKGLSHKEVADVRSVTEATARQQARALYKKAGLAGRHDLAAFFLEDLILPSGQQPP